ncbi:hypothetical protein CWIS_04530 [Cellulomonas sp. A375-1]|nr:hypothetical protein CWIS_04530 [Cellulomonas sp. A375-1]
MRSSIDPLDEASSARPPTASTTTGPSDPVTRSDPSTRPMCAEPDLNDTSASPATCVTRTSPCPPTTARRSAESMASSPYATSARTAPSRPDKWVAPYLFAVSTAEPSGTSTTTSTESPGPKMASRNGPVTTTRSPTRLTLTPSAAARSPERRGFDGETETVTSDRSLATTSMRPIWISTRTSPVPSTGNDLNGPTP